jgi:hypothetical protein
MSRYLRMRGSLPSCGVVIAGNIWWLSFPICPMEKHLEGTGMNLSAHPMTGQLMVSIETSTERDEALILKFKSSSNRPHFHILTRNCVDFVKDVINL